VVSAILITILLTLTLNYSLVKQFTFIITLATFAQLIPYTMTTMAELLLFVTDREKFQVKRLTKSVIIASLAFIYSFWAMSGAEHDVVYYGCLLFFSGVPVYVWMIWHNRYRLMRV